MDKAELHKEFSSRVDEFERYQNFIEKARTQSGRFAAAVVEKVIKDNEEKSLKVVGEIIPLIADMQEVISGLQGQRDEVLNGRESSQLQLEELELRLAIGEIDDASFESESKELRDSLGSIDSRVATIDEELGQFNGVMERWTDLGTKAGVLADDEPAEAPAEEPVIEEVPEVEEELDMAAFEDDGRGEGVRAERVAVAEDVSVVFEAEEVEADGEVLEAADSLELGEIDVLGEEDALPVGDDEAGDEQDRRAVLLYQEGTAEEQIHHFSNDQLTLGRGRDNDIQVKNDSKVSRYHCKLYRRGPNFYIEDNKSANGTLVNGELITERRLFGGEEIIIGETFFRFRILD